VTDLLTQAAGASAVLQGGYVVYAERLKHDWLEVPEALLIEPGAVSEAVACALARSVRHRAQATFGLATTGFAGPGGGTATDPVGTVYLALSSEAGERCERAVYRGDRERVRSFGAYGALDLLRRHVLEGRPSP
jgi:PncC family amidohydrolase